MPQTRKHTVSVPAEQAAFIDKQVASGAYASTGEVIRAGLRALLERDHTFERWLKDEVAPAYDDMAADPTLGTPAATVFDAVRARHVARLRDRE